MSSTTPKICLTGTTGGLGSRVLHHLIHTLKYPPSSLIISLYNPSSLPSSYSSLNLDVRRGDFTDPASLRSSFQGADKLLLVSYPSIAHDVRVSAHQNAIDAAKEVGVKHLYYTSLAFAEDSKAAVMGAHISTAAYLKEICRDSEMCYTVLKEGIYSESFPMYFGFFDAEKMRGQAERVVKVHGNGGVAWVTRDDLGEGTARILTSSTADKRFRRQTVLLSGDAVLSFTELAGMITQILGWQENPVKVEVVGKQAYVDFQTERRMGKKDDAGTREFMSGWASTYPAIERGELTVMDPLLGNLLGRDLRGMRSVLEDTLGVEDEHLGKYATTA